MSFKVGDEVRVTNRNSSNRFRCGVIVQVDEGINYPPFKVQLVGDPPWRLGGYYSSGLELVEPVPSEPPQ